jgi:hypothetical protein
MTKMCSAPSDLLEIRAKRLMLNDFLVLLPNWAIQREARRIKHLARSPAGFPQSYPQKSGIARKLVFNHRLKAVS